MRYKDLPIEIQQKIKERIEEQGNVFDEACYTLDKHHGGFTWNETPERKDFWVDVLGRGRHYVFYERYPREISFDKPFRKDDVVKCINNSFNSNTKVIGKHFQLRDADTNKLNNGRVTSLKSYPSGECNEFRVNFSSTDLVIVARAEINLSEQSKQTTKMETKSDFEDEAHPDEKEGTQYLVFMGKWEGEIVELYHNDDTSMPKFKKADGGTSWLEWRCLKRTHQVIAESSTDRYRVKTFEEFGNERPEDWADEGEMDHFYGHELTKGQIEKYLSRNNNGNSDFLIADCWWVRCNDIVKIETINFTNTLNSTNYGSKVNSNSSSSTFISRIPSTVSYGTTPRGVAVSCSRGKILLGS